METFSIALLKKNRRTFDCRIVYVVSSYFNIACKFIKVVCTTDIGWFVVSVVSFYGIVNYFVAIM